LAISPIPPPQRDKTAHLSVRFNNARLSIFSLKAEADSHLRVGNRALWFVIGSPGGGNRAEMNSTPGLTKKTGNKGFNLERIFSITYIGDP
jgi:hypothetical protein